MCVDQPETAEPIHCSSLYSNFLSEKEISNQMRIYFVNASINISKGNLQLFTPTIKAILYSECEFIAGGNHDSIDIWKSALQAL